MRIGFDCGNLSERGTAVAVYDYAFHGRKLLGFEPVILFDSRLEINAAVLARFREQFSVVPYEGIEGLLREDGRLKLDAFYSIKGGEYDGKVFRHAKTLVHAVFGDFEPHGDIYAYVSRWLSDDVTGGLYPYVPHIVSLPPPRENLRTSLGIPESAFVVGRYGGYEQFDIAFAHRAVLAALERRRDLTFIFVNTKPFCEHERAHFLPAIIDPTEKANFITACDAGIHARMRGETFGLAVAEFMYFDKPVVTWAGSKERHHIELVKRADKRFLYRNFTGLVALLCEMERISWNGRWSNAVRPFAPQAVMEAFDKVFLKAPAMTKFPPLGVMAALKQTNRRMIAEIERKGDEVLDGIRRTWNAAVIPMRRRGRK